MSRWIERGQRELRRASLWWGRRGLQRFLHPLVVGLHLLAMALAAVGVLAFPGPFQEDVVLQPGQVAPRDFVAPRRITYESQVLTQLARERAAQSIPDEYDPPLARVRWEQVELARRLLGTIRAIREAAGVSPAAKLEQLQALPELSLSPATGQRILDLTPEEWLEVEGAVPGVLDQAMRGEIREDSLANARRRVPALIPPDLNPRSAQVTVELVRPLIRPNSFFNPERTQALREQARSRVRPQLRTLEEGEIILRAGDVATPADVEALEQLGLTSSGMGSRDRVRNGVLGLILWALLLGAVYRQRPGLFQERRLLGLFTVLVVMGLVTARLTLVSHPWLPYLYPLAAFCMLAVLLFDAGITLALLVFFSLVVAQIGYGDTHLITYTVVGALTGVLALGKAERLGMFLTAGLAIFLANLAVSAAFWAQVWRPADTQALVQTLSLAALNGSLSTSLALIGYFALGSLFGIATPLQLMELSRPTHPLLRQLLLKAPGTYHHTILVSNMAERAAEAIGADALLARVGAYYHDIGKTVRPYFFAENLMDGPSPHQDLDPKTSAQIIISHVKDGLDLARKYRLPEAIRAFIREHHGTQLMRFFYDRALEQGQEAVDAADFRYPGPDPHSKETAILMLADTCEAAVRAERPATRRELEQMVRELVMARVVEGSLNRSNLTFRELAVIQEIFVQVLQGVHHPRHRYPAHVQPLASPAVESGPSRAPAGELPVTATANGDEPLPRSRSREEEPGSVSVIDHAEKAG